VESGVDVGSDISLILPREDGGLTSLGTALRPWEWGLAMSGGVSVSSIG
jgi:hypothetical protein